MFSTSQRFHAHSIRLLLSPCALCMYILTSLFFAFKRKRFLFLFELSFMCALGCLYDWYILRIKVKKKQQANICSVFLCFSHLFYKQQMKKFQFLCAHLLLFLLSSFSFVWQCQHAYFHRLLYAKYMLYPLLFAGTISRFVFIFISNRHWVLSLLSRNCHFIISILLFPSDTMQFYWNCLWLCKWLYIGSGILKLEFPYSVVNLFYGEQFLVPHQKALQRKQGFIGEVPVRQEDNLVFSCNKWPFERLRISIINDSVVDCDIITRATVAAILPEDFDLFVGMATNQGLIQWVKPYFLGFLQFARIFKKKYQNRPTSNFPIHTKNSKSATNQVTNAPWKQCQ